MTTLASYTRTTAAAPAALAALLILASCGTTALFPATESDARGTLAPYAYDMSATYSPDTAIFRLTIEEDEYSYYTDAVLYIYENTVIGDEFGKTLGMGDLSAGMWVEVWTDSCAESYPVQCDVTHVRLTYID